MFFLLVPGTEFTSLFSRCRFKAALQTFISLSRYCKQHGFTAIFPFASASYFHFRLLWVFWECVVWGVSVFWWGVLFWGFFVFFCFVGGGLVGLLGATIKVLLFTNFRSTDFTPFLTKPVEKDFCFL